MKALFDWLLGPGPARPLRNKPGGMAWVKNLDAQDGSADLNGRAVKTVRIEGERMWQIEPIQIFNAACNVAYVQDGTTSLYAAGDPVGVRAIADECLEPWQDDGVTDEEVRDLFAPDTTTTTKEKNNVD